MKSAVPNWQKLAAELEAGDGAESPIAPEAVNERPKTARHLTLVPPKDVADGKKR